MKHVKYNYYNNKKFYSFRRTTAHAVLLKSRTKEVYKTLVDKFNLKKGGTYVDCGSAFGGEALQFFDAFDKIYCF